MVNQKTINKFGSFLDEFQPQIGEIRLIFVRALVSFLIGASIGIFLNQQIILYILSFFDLKKVNIVLTSPYQFINLAVSLSIILGVTMMIPVLGFYVLKFVKPALNEKEYKLAKRLIPMSLFLFLFGCFFGAKIEQFVITMYAETTASYSLNNFWDIESFLNQVMIMSGTMGFVFLLPIFLTILIKIKLISTKTLASQRRFVYAGLTIFGVLLPPNDALSLIMIITPLFLLFEGTLLLNRD